MQASTAARSAFHCGRIDRMFPVFPLLRSGRSRMLLFFAPLFYSVARATSAV
ncbi:hypothetical protein BURPS305_6274 [Burkholderia pseudomallei 305]|nr:hypothetical protein BURPS305_6274 [Burkholderia pseudomallei 305]